MQNDQKQPFTTYELEEDFSDIKDKRFSMSLDLVEQDDYDNKEAMGMRMSFVLIDQGSGVALIDGKQIPYIAPCIFCINEQEHIVVGNENESRIRVLLFHPEMVNYLLDFNNIRMLTELVPLTIRQDRALLNVFINDRKRYSKALSLGSTSYKKLSEILMEIQSQINKQDTDNWPCRARFFVMEILFVLETLYEANGYGKELQPDDLEEDFTPILSYINLHYNEKIVVNDITERFHISRTTMSNMFRENVGDTFLNYINKLRIHMATLMLRDTSLPVGEIMYHVGFSDMAHFLRMFKRYIGMTPSLYREKYS